MVDQRCPSFLQNLLVFCFRLDSCYTFGEETLNICLQGDPGPQLPSNSVFATVDSKNNQRCFTIHLLARWLHRFPLVHSTLATICVPNRSWHVQCIPDVVPRANEFPRSRFDLWGSCTSTVCSNVGLHVFAFASTRVCASSRRTRFAVGACAGHSQWVIHSQTGKVRSVHLAGHRHFPHLLRCQAKRALSC